MSRSSDPAMLAETTVILPANLHARPAGRLAQAAAGFQSTIQLEHNGRTINPTGVLAVMGLGATAGALIKIRAEGPDAEHAAQTLAELLGQVE